MTIELGRYGIWRAAGQLSPEPAAEIEALGYGAIWIGGPPPGDLALAGSMLAATSRITVATGIVNMWATPAAAAAASYHRIEAAHPGRFLLGVGIGHPEATSDYRRPYATMVGYLDALEAAGVPVAGRALAALGPRGEPGPRLRAGPCSRTPATTVTAATVSRDGTPGAPAAR